MTGLHQEPPERRVDGEPEELLAMRRDRARFVERTEGAQLGACVLERMGLGRVEQRERLDVRPSASRRGEEQRDQRLAVDLRRRLRLERPAA